MGQFKFLTEARIRDFNHRKEEGEVKTVTETPEGESLESMLFDEVVELRHLLASAEDEERASELRQKIQSLETRLLVSLENMGRPLAARMMAERLRDAARGNVEPR